MGRRDGGHARRGVSDSRRGAEAAKGGERRGNGASPAGVLTAATTAPPAGGAHWGGPPATAGMGSACVGHARRRGASTQHPAIHCGTGTTPLGTGTGAGGREGGKGGVRGGEGGSPLLKGGGECCPSAPRTGVARSHTLDTARRARPCGASRRAERRARAWRPPPARPLSVRVGEGPTNEGRPRVAAVGGHLRRRDGRRGRRVCSSQCEKSGRRGPLARAPGRGRDAARPHTGVGGSPPLHRHGRWGGFVSRLFLSFAWRRARHTRGVTASAAPHWAVRGTRGNLDAQGPAAAGTHRNETRVNLADDLPYEPIRHAAGRARVQKEGIGAATGGAWTERSGGAVGQSAGGTRPPLPVPVGNSPISGCAASRPNAASDSRQLAEKQTRRQ